MLNDEAFSRDISFIEAEHFPEDFGLLRDILNSSLSLFLQIVEERPTETLYGFDRVKCNSPEFEPSFPKEIVNTFDAEENLMDSLAFFSFYDFNGEISEEILTLFLTSSFIERRGYVSALFEEVFLNKNLDEKLEEMDSEDEEALDESLEEEKFDGDLPETKAPDNAGSKVLIGPSLVVGIPNASGTFQSPATLVMDGILDLHYDIMGVMLAIVVFVFYMLAVAIFFGTRATKSSLVVTYTHNTLIEVI